MLRAAAILTVAVMALASDAIAQDRRSHAALARLVASGEEVAVHVDGEEDPLRARVESAANGLLTLEDATGRRHLVALPSVARIERAGDTVADGILIGSALGPLCFLTCGQGASSSKHLKQLVVANTIMGGVWGWLIDRRTQGTTIVYRRERPTDVVVAISPTAVGLEVRLRLP
jgi:hypothetical protein